MSFPQRPVSLLAAELAGFAMHGVMAGARTLVDDSESTGCPTLGTEINISMRLECRSGRAPASVCRLLSNHRCEAGLWSSAWRYSWHRDSPIARSTRA